MTTISTAQDTLVYVNGELVPGDRAFISVYDSGLNFADGVFEGIRVYSGRVFCLERHVQRLFRSAQALQIDIGMTPEEFGAEIIRWLRAANVVDGFHLKPIVTRGDRFPPRLDPRMASAGPNIIFLGAPVAPAPSGGILVIISSVRRTRADAFDPRIKSLGYGNNLLARLEASRAGVNDALMLDQDGFLAEATASNVFIVRDGVLYTPWPRACLEGITQSLVSGLAAHLGHQVVRQDLGWGDLANADEIFATGTATEITPIVEVSGVSIGTGEPGPITCTLMDRYAALVRSEGTPIGSVME
jgi:branched-chain amino acid aminotransferase